MLCDWQDLGADALEILDELVECEIAIIQPHIKAVIGFCLEVRALHWETVANEGVPRNGSGITDCCC